MLIALKEHLDKRKEAHPTVKVRSTDTHETPNGNHTTIFESPTDNRWMDTLPFMYICLFLFMMMIGLVFFTVRKFRSNFKARVQRDIEAKAIEKDADKDVRARSFDLLSVVTR